MATGTIERVVAPRPKDQRATLRQRMHRLLAAMTKSKKHASPNLDADLFILPEDLLWDILLWSRPDDDDQSIWLWLCRVSGTCREFRRLVCMEKKGGVPHSLLPTVFKLLPQNRYYLDHVRDGFYRSRDTDFLRVKLMKTIRRSKWMGLQLKSIHSYDIDDAYVHYSLPIAKEVKKLIMSPCSPNLVDIKMIRVDIPWHFPFFDQSFLRNLAKRHSSLKTLDLIDVGPSMLNPPPRVMLTPDTISTFAASMPHLQHVGLGYSRNWMSNSHVGTFLSNLNPSVTSLTLDYGHHAPTKTTGAFLLSYALPNLESLRIRCMRALVSTERLGRVLGSIPTLSHVDVSNLSTDSSDKGVMNAIVGSQLKLETFRAYGCRWFCDECLIRLVSFQIDTFGTVLLRTLGIFGTRVTPDGLRTALTKWSETDDPESALTVELFDGNQDHDQMWQHFVAEFPKVEFTMMKGEYEI